MVGKQPDGDSIRFVPDTTEVLDSLRRGWRVRRSSDGVDAAVGAAPIDTT